MFYLFFIEISWNAFQFFAIGVGAAILFLGGLSVAIKNIRTNWIQPVWDKCFSPIFTRGKKINDLVESVAKLTEMSAKIEHEVLTNSGSSLKDSVIRIEKNHLWIFSKLRHNDHISYEALFESDEKGNLIFVNRGFCDLLAVSEKDLLYRAWLMRVEPDSRERVKSEWKEAIENKITLDSRQTLIGGKDGKLLMIHIHAQPHLDIHGNLIGFFGHVQIVK
jgi:PAS domain S-box-containing protein